MQVISNILTAYILIIIFSCFTRPKWAAGLYLIYILLVPYLNLEAFGMSFQHNIVTLSLLLGLFLHRMEKKIYWKPFIPFFFFYFMQILVFPFQELPTSVMMNTWRADTMKFLILPFVIYNLVVQGEVKLKYFTNIMLAIILIATVYGLWLTLVPGTNPYIMAISLINGEEFNEAYALGLSGLATDIDYKIETGRAFGRISSVFNHPMKFGLFLTFSLFFLLGEFNQSKKKTRKIFISFLIALVLTNAFTCGVRTVLAAIAIGITFFLIRRKNLQLLIKALFFSIIGYFILLHLMPNLNEYILSMADRDGTQIGGSSSSMRLEQLEGCFEEIKNNFVFGKGYGWTTLYLQANEIHPVILAFESLIFVVICNEGAVFGFALWALFLYFLIRTIRQLPKKTHRIYLQTLLVAYLAYATVTGDYEYMQYFILFFILMYLSFKTKKYIK